LPKSHFLAFANGVRSKVETRLRRRLASELREQDKFGPEAASACEALSDLCLRGGKRLRAVLVCAGARCVSRRQNESLLIEIGAAVELLHAYFLVHDDWIDGDLVRRGGPSAHAQLRHMYGEAAGDAAAILAGDWGATVANEWMAQLPVPRAALTKLLSTFSQMQRAAIGGQMRDILANGNEIERTYEFKTASYTVQGPLTLGAIVGGATAQQLTAIGKVSIPLGVAFQLRDDLIGLFGAPAETGKPFGSDVRAGKQTMAAIYALRRARGSDRRVLTEVFGNPRASTRQLRDAVRVFDSIGAKRIVEERIACLLDSANHQIRLAPISEEGRQLLVSTATALALRSA
jgi:geranylgeranyl diphosphate synthase type I